jgi:glycosyltransferase involved in cell wall biosynthesis
MDKIMSGSRLKRRSKRLQKAFAEPLPQLSFIIPALNEERHIANVVKQFDRLQGHVQYEVIVADGDSEDQTVGIATQHGARVYVDKSQHKTIASGRNLGAKHARGDLLIFCDADTQLEDPVAFVNRIFNVFQDERVVGAVPRLQVIPAERTTRDRLFSAFLNRFIKASFHLVVPFSFGQCQVVRKSSFKRVHGYNQHQVHGEDSGLFQKLRRLGHLRFMWDVSIFESPRRYRKVGYFNLVKTGVLSMLGQLVLRRNVLTKWERVD